MKAGQFQIKYIVTVLVLGGAIGCGNKEDSLAVSLPPPAPDAKAEVTMPAPAFKPDGTPTAIPDAPPVPPPTTDEGLKAITKGMTEQQVKEFKETASFETHDTQIALISEAANTYYNEFNRAPANVEALVKAGHLSRLLVAPKGKKYVIDPKTLAVTSVNQ